VEIASPPPGALGHPLYAGLRTPLRPYEALADVSLQPRCAQPSRSRRSVCPWRGSPRLRQESRPRFQPSSRNHPRSGHDEGEHPRRGAALEDCARRLRPFEIGSAPGPRLMWALPATGRWAPRRPAITHVTRPHAEDWSRALRAARSVRGGRGESLALNTVRLGGFRQGPGMQRVRPVGAVHAP
jgi:hypothetical protein